MKAPLTNSIYGEITRLVPIRVGDLVFEVPDDIPLIRAFQYIQFELNRMTCDWTRFCFNDTIGCCHFRFQPPGADAPGWGRACCERVVEGMLVHTLPQGSVLFDEHNRPRFDIPSSPGPENGPENGPRRGSGRTGE